MPSDAASRGPWQDQGPRQPPRIRVLALLFLVYTFNYLDRQVLVILAEPIKREFGLRDWQIGFLTGLTFALFYASLGIPIARLADRRNRAHIIAGALALWSAMTCMCAAASSFAQLAMARVGVGVGEGGGGPPAISLLGSYFQRHQRATAMAVYSLGAPVGTLLGFVVGGWVNESMGWRSAFLAAGFPGLVLAAVVWRFVPDTRSLATHAPPPRLPALGVSATVRQLYSIRTYRQLIAGTVFAGIAVYAFMIWVPVYLLRQFGANTRDTGLLLGLAAGIPGSIGVLLGGWATDRLGMVHERWRLGVPALTMLLFMPAIWLVVESPTLPAASLCVALAYLLALAYTGPAWAAVQTVVPEHMRAMAAALLFLLVNLIGLGLGPQVVGLISDLLGATANGASLRRAIEAASGTAGLAAACFYAASRSLEADAERASMEPG